MKILALDFGTTCGWAVGTTEQPGVFDCGSERLATSAQITEAGKTRMDRRRDPRIPRFHAWLVVHCVRYAPDWIVFEDVQFSKTTQQTQLWASYRAVVWLFERCANIECCPVGTLKKFATGNGGADKDMMARMLIQTNPRFQWERRKKVNEVKDTQTGNFLDDNAVDAVHLLNWARKTLARSPI